MASLEQIRRGDAWRGALASGAKVYSTGIPCKRGHVSLRQTSDRSCVVCKRAGAKTPRFIEAQRRYRERPENKREKKDQVLRANYGISIHEYEVLLAEQGYQCQICKSDLEFGRSRRGAAVDHCHATKAIRGILCNPCNRAIGLLKDSPSIAEAAAAYLRRAK